MKNDFRGDVYQNYKSISNKIFSNSSNIRSTHPQFQFSKFIDKRNARVLELGCGNGEFLRCIIKTGKIKQAIGVDISIQDKKIIQDALLDNVILKSCTISQALIDYQNYSFDYIFAIDVFEHFSQDELFELLPNIQKCLGPKGKLIVRVPNMHSPLCAPIAFGDITHVSFFTPISIKQLFVANSFDNVNVFSDFIYSKYKLVYLCRKIISTLFDLILTLLYVVIAGRRVSIFSPNLIAVAECPSTRMT